MDEVTLGSICLPVRSSGPPLTSPGSQGTEVLPLCFPGLVPSVTQCADAGGQLRAAGTEQDW